MESKNKFWKGALAGALLTAFAGLIIVGMSMGIFLIGRTAIDGKGQTAESNEAKNQEGSLDVNRISTKVSYLQKIIDQYYLFDEDTQKVEDWIYKGMMFGLDDPYTVYYTAEEYQNLSEETQGEYNGIGIMISQNYKTGIITVIKVFEDTPAAEAGMRPGDILYKVDGEEVTGIDLSLLVKKYIKGTDGTSVTLTVFREKAGEYVDMTMKRTDVTVQTVEYRMMEGKTGYVEVSQFDQITTDQFKKAIDDLEDQGMEKLIIDLRSNPGGILDTATAMLDYILPDDLVIEGDPKLIRDQKDHTLLIYTADKNGAGQQYYCSDHHQVDVPLAVLINGDAASASEVFAGAVKDYGRGTLVGMKTFGKGIVQSVFPLDNGTAIKMTTSHYYTPSGIDLHGKGIEPDVEIDLDEELKTQLIVDPEEDGQLQKAIEVLEKRRP